MDFIRFCRVDLQSERLGASTYCTQWMQDTPLLRFDLMVIIDAGIDLYGEGSHWLESTEGESRPAPSTQGVQQPPKIKGAKR